MIQKVIYFEKDVRNVTALYYHVILKALEKNGVEITKLNDLPELNGKGRYINTFLLVTTLFDCWKLYLKGYRNFIYWFQGIEPEEHFLINKSKLKFLVVSFIEKMVLKICRYRFGVSKYQFEHYNNKYHLNLKRQDYEIMPCFNTRFNESSFLKEGKYQRNVFCYAGGMQAWQGVDLVFNVFEQLESKYGEKVFLKVLSKDFERSKELLLHYKIKNYSIDTIPPEKLDEEIAECKFGFILREDNIINRVATPTKLSSYMANGVIPVITDSIKSYRDLADKYSYICCLTDINDISAIEKTMQMNIEAHIIQDEYAKVFADYYNIDKYTKIISEYLCK